MTPWYDTLEGLQARLKMGMTGLRAIAQARREAGYNRREKLRTWCIAGSYYTDSCGNFSLITCGSPKDTAKFMDVYDVPNVIPEGDMQKFTQYWTTTMEKCLPSVGALCDRCGKGWTLDNCRDYWHDHTGAERHRTCHRLYVVERDVRALTNLVQRAEIPFTDAYAIPNEYFNDPDFFGPWMMIETPAGRIKIGWRKRVLNIDWSGLGFVVPSDLFANENVTKFQFLIHAWGEDKAVEYLRGIWRYAPKNDVSEEI